MTDNPHRYTLQILEDDLDTFGHVNNARYLSLFEEARWDLITHNGYGIARIKELEIGPVILEVNVRFMKELKLRETIVIESRVTSCTKKIFVIEHKIIRGDELCCTAVFTLGLFDLNTRKMIELTGEWLKAIDTSGCT